MTDPARLLLLWLAALSALTLALFGWDKTMAKLARRRVPEATLLLFCALGGAPGGLVGMYLFRHKIRKPKFYLTLPLLLLLHGALAALVLIRT